jgi:uncharacterized membrane protein YgcG
MVPSRQDNPMDSSRNASSRGRWGLVLASLLLSGGVAGCGMTDNRAWWNVDNCSTIPSGAIPRVPGLFLNQINVGQQDRAQAEKLVVYKHEWYLEKTEPGPAGRRHLASIRQMLDCVPKNWPVVIEPVEPEDEEVVSFEATRKLNEARRQKVVDVLVAQGYPRANERVIIGYPTAEGLYGDPAALIGGRYIFTQSGLGVGGGGGGFGGGFGGGGFGGGAMIGGGGGFL